MQWRLPKYAVEVASLIWNSEFPLIPNCFHALGNIITCLGKVSSSSSSYQLIQLTIVYFTSRSTLDEGSVRNVDVVVHYVVQGVVDECSLITCPSNLQCHVVKGMLNALVSTRTNRVPRLTRGGKSVDGCLVGDSRIIRNSSISRFTHRVIASLITIFSRYI